MGGDVHLEGTRTPRQRTTDSPEPDDAEPDVGDAPELARGTCAPGTRAHAPIELDDPAHQREQKRERVIGHLVDAVVGDVAHPHAPPRRRLDVDVVDADTRRRDHP